MLLQGDIFQNLQIYKGLLNLSLIFQNLPILVLYLFVIH